MTEAEALTLKVGDIIICNTDNAKLQINTIRPNIEGDPRLWFKCTVIEEGIDSYYKLGFTHWNVSALNWYNLHKPIEVREEVNKVFGSRLDYID